jgi:hypothetical protein
MAADFCRTQLNFDPLPGPHASLEHGEVITLGMFAHFWRFHSEQNFYCYAERRLKAAIANLTQKWSLFSNKGAI